MSNLIDAECSGCKYWEGYNLDDFSDYGDCRRYPPKMTTGDKEKGELDVIPLHPRVYFSDWCGEFKAL